jgi:peptidoglycan/xylan/chitin deacetylase (PgdA/CDA1 family)
MSQNSKPTVCLTFDFDAFSLWMGSFGLSSPTDLSRGEFGGRVGVPRILRLLAREQIEATFYIPGHTVDSFPDVCAEIREAGHEIGHHGYLHESPVELDEQQEREVIEKGLAALQRIEVTPAGYRSPGWDLSPNSVRLLQEYGFVYDSSMMATDYKPYWCRRNDIAHRDRGYQWGEEVELVEIPVSWTLDDFPQMEYLPSLSRPGLSGYDKTLGMWRTDFDYMLEEEPDGVFCITFHPQVIGRGGRMTILQSLITHMKASDASFRRVGDVVADWKAAHPLSGPPVH